MFVRFPELEWLCSINLFRTSLGSCELSLIRQVFIFLIMTHPDSGKVESTMIDI